MNFMRIKRFSLIGALGASAVFAAYDGLLFFWGRAPEQHLFRLHQFVLSILMATWLVTDAKESGRACPSLDYGWFVLTTFPFYVPYYLVATRRWRRGMLILLGMVLLFLLPWLAELCASRIR